MFFILVRVGRLFNAEHRAMKLARLLASRKKAEKREEQKSLETYRLLFQIL